MAGIGEASAIATFVPIGFSLATSLTTYIGDVKDAPDEIASLAVEIDATLRLVEELEVLLTSNKATGGWNDNGVAFAIKCRRDSERVISKLLKLLTKSKSSVAGTGAVSHKDIDISLFNRVLWPRFKPKVEVAKRELERTRIDILLARDLYKAKTGRVS